MLMILLILQPFLGLAWTTERPIIGILAQPAQESLDTAYPPHTSYIAASYVKAVEQTGARAVPIFVNRTKDYYRELLSSLNGVIFPGGTQNFTSVGGYADAGRIIINYTKEVNARGDNFPVLGVCLGHELLLYLEVENYDILDYCNATDQALPLQFKKTYHSSRLFHRAPRKIIKILSDLPVTYNYHERCVTEKALKQYKLDKAWHVLSTSVEEDRKKFIAIVESRQFPIVGIQFHPEKNAYEWNAKHHFPHSEMAVSSARYFYDWLTSEARKSNHSFNDPKTEAASLIYNYNVTYVAGYFEQLYLFK